LRYRLESPLCAKSDEWQKRKRAFDSISVFETDDDAAPPDRWLSGHCRQTVNGTVNATPSGGGRVTVDISHARFLARILQRVARPSVTFYRPNARKPVALLRFIRYA